MLMLTRDDVNRNANGNDHADVNVHGSSNDNDPINIQVLFRVNINITFSKPILATSEEKKNISALTTKTMRSIRGMLPEEYC